VNKTFDDDSITKFLSLGEKVKKGKGEVKRREKVGG